jgi:hypothetical protein
MRNMILALSLLFLVSCNAKTNVTTSGSGNGSDDGTTNQTGPTADLSMIASHGPVRTATDNGATDDLAAADNVCAAAVSHMLNDCGFHAEFNASQYVCANVYGACEARCYVNTPCSVLTQGGDATLTTCLNSCYADGPASCKQAEEKTACECFESFATTWNLDGFCDAAEKCSANCAMAVKATANRCVEVTQVNSSGHLMGRIACGTCTDLVDLSSSYSRCAARCGQAKLREGSQLEYDTTYCARYPADPHCGSAARAAIDRRCLVYPASAECADPVAYCNAHPNDTSCAYYCTVDGSCWGRNYCVAHMHNDVACSVGQQLSCTSSSIPDVNNACVGACVDTSSLSNLFNCYTCLCGSHPQSCGQSGAETSNVNCPHGRQICCTYPQSLECDAANYDIYRNWYE